MHGPARSYRLIGRSLARSRRFDELEDDDIYIDFGEEEEDEEEDEFDFDEDLDDDDDEEDDDEDDIDGDEEEGRRGRRR